MRGELSKLFRFLRADREIQHGVSIAGLLLAIFSFFLSELSLAAFTCPSGFTPTHGSCIRNKDSCYVCDYTCQGAGGCVSQACPGERTTDCTAGFKSWCGTYSPFNGRTESCCSVGGGTAFNGNALTYNYASCAGTPTYSDATCTTDTTSRATTLTVNTDSGATQTQTYRINHVAPGDRVSLGVASLSASQIVDNGDTTTTVASKVAALWNGTNAYGSPYTTNSTITVTSSGNLVTITHNSGHGDAGLSVSPLPTCAPTPAPAAIAISPTSFNFGTVIVGTTTTAQTVTINNTGGAASGCTYSVSDSATFLLSGQSSCSSIGANSSCAFSISARPAVNQTYNGTLTASCSGGGSPNSAASLTVAGALPPAPSLSWNQGNSTLPSIPAGTTNSIGFNVLNTGTADGTSCSIYLTGGTPGASFSWGPATTSGVNPCYQANSTGSAPFGSSSDPSKGCSGQLNYTPVEGPNQVTMQLVCSNGSSNTITAYMTGTVYPNFASQGTQNFTSPDPVMIDYRPESDHAAGSKVFTFTNTGTGSCLNFSATLSQSRPNFTITSNPCQGQNVAKNGTCDVTITGKPDQTDEAPLGPTGQENRSANIQILCGTSASNTGFGPSTRGTVTLNARQCPTGSRFIPGTSNCDCQYNAPPATTFSSQLWKCIACPQGSILDTSGYCHCPFGHENIDDFCKPILPSLEFVRDTNEFPVCSPPNHTGALFRRIPTTYALTAVNASGPTVPLIGGEVTMTTALTGSQDIKSAAKPSPYPYSRPFGSPSPYPLYAYFNQPHCACVNHTASVSPSATPGPVSLLASQSGGQPRFSGDTLDFIASVDRAGLPNRTYGMVATATDGKSDGRLGSIINATSGVRSQCACPNVNEEPTRINSSDPQSGVVCAPPASLRNDPNVAFAPFSNAKDNASGASQVFTDSTEPKNGSAIVETISLPASQAAPNSLKTYQRHIWKCQLGYTLDLSTKTCTIDWSTNQCDSTSPIGGADWTTTINKKLACCMNQFNTGTTNSSKLKFDCMDNSTSSHSNFNSLWASADSAATGGQLNALLLMGQNGKPITGFYTLEGARCNEFSEFSSVAIQPGTVNPLVKDQQQQIIGTGANDEFVANGSPLPTPSGQGWTDMIAGLDTKAVAPNPSAATAPEIAKARRCPVLVRAAAVYTCPKDFAGSNAPRFTTKDASNRTRCVSAENVQVHLRVEQVFNIAGQAPLQTVDTVIDRRNAGSVNLEQIIRSKNNGACPPGTVPSSSGCRY